DRQRDEPRTVTRPRRGDATRVGRRGSRAAQPGERVRALHRLVCRSGALPNKGGPMKRFVVGNTVLALLVAATGHAARREPRLQQPQLSAGYAKLRDLILPNSREQSYRKITWRASVLCGIVDAQKKDRPVMIVLMNGHPLGCT